LEANKHFLKNWDTIVTFFIFWIDGTFFQLLPYSVSDHHLTLYRCCGHIEDVYTTFWNLCRHVYLLHRRLNLPLLRPSPVLPKKIKISRLFKISEFFFFFFFFFFLYVTCLINLQQEITTFAFDYLFNSILVLIIKTLRL
jgi:hypothetical protein